MCKLVTSEPHVTQQVWCFFKYVSSDRVPDNCMDKTIFQDVKSDGMFSSQLSNIW